MISTAVGGNHERDQRAITSKLAFGRPFSALLACACTHAYVRVSGRMCGCVYDAWVAGGWEKCVRGVKRPRLMEEMMKRVFFRDALNKNNDDNKRVEMRLRCSRGILQRAFSNESSAPRRYSEPAQSQNRNFSSGAQHRCESNT